jgi:hypothetical protein
VHVETAYQSRLETYLGTRSALCGDEVYRISTPGDGEEESNEPLALFPIVFRDSKPCSKAIDQLLTARTFHRLHIYKTPGLLDAFVRELNALRDACVGRIEICPTNLPVMNVLLRKPEVLLAHISYATALVLVAWFQCRRIPEYLVDIVSEEPHLKRSLRCPAGAKISVETHECGGETMIFQLPEKDIEERGGGKAPRRGSPRNREDRDCHRRGRGPSVTYEITPSALLVLV